MEQRIDAIHGAKFDKIEPSVCHRIYAAIQNLRPYSRLFRFLLIFKAFTSAEKVRSAILPTASWFYTKVFS